MKIRSGSSDAHRRPRAPLWPRRVDILLGLVALAWLAGLTASLVMKVWPVVVLLLGVGLAAVRMIQILSYRD